MILQLTSIIIVSRIMELFLLMKHSMLVSQIAKTMVSLELIIILLQTLASVHMTHINIIIAAFL